MTLQLNFKIIDRSYSQDYADQYEQGKESLNNRKYHYSKSFEIADVKRIEKLTEEAYVLKAELDDGSLLQKKIQEVFILRVTTADGKRDYAVSKKLLKKTHEAFREKENVTRFYFYLNDGFEYQQVLNGVFLLEEEITSGGFVPIPIKFNN